MNKIIIKGRLVADPELKTTANGKNVVNFKIAVDRKYSKEKLCDFFDCFAWEKAADFIFKYFNKGKEILATGEMQCRKWQDNDGKNRYTWEMKVDEVEFCGSKNDTNSAPSESIPTYSEQSANMDELPDDSELPF